MAILTGQLKRGINQCLFDISQDAAVPFADVLKQYQKRGFEAIKTGVLITSTSGNGKSSQFAPPDIGKMFTQDQIFELSQELRETYTGAVAALALQGISSPDDPTIFNTMQAMDNLQSITEYQNDYTALRFGYRR